MLDVGFNLEYCGHQIIENVEKMICADANEMVFKSKMNNRQKAKHFKRLYEMGLPKKHPLLFQRTMLKHYGVAARVPLWDEDYPMCRVEDNLIHNLRDIEQ